MYFRRIRRVGDTWSTPETLATPVTRNMSPTYSLEIRGWGLQAISGSSQLKSQPCISGEYVRLMFWVGPPGVALVWAAYMETNPSLPRWQLQMGNKAFSHHSSHIRRALKLHASRSWVFLFIWHRNYIFMISYLVSCMFCRYDNFLVMFLTKEFTYVIPTYFEFIWMPIIQTRRWCVFLHPNVYVMNLSWMIEIWMKIG